MSDFSLIGYARATTDELSDGTYTFFDLGPSDVKAWCPDIIIEAPVPEPSVNLLLVAGLCLMAFGGRGRKDN